MRKSLPNLLIVCGAGRNTGKSTLTKMLINKYAINYKLAACKITPHFHEQPESKIKLWQSKNCIVYLENEISHKDSSQFLQAGADPVYYIECKDYKTEEAFEALLNHLGDGKLIICESGYLANLYKPGVLVFLETKDNKDLKADKFTVKEFADIRLCCEMGKLDDELNKIIGNIFIKDNKWKKIL
jgi:hypothetical protein